MFSEEFESICMLWEFIPEPYIRFWNNSLNICTFLEYSDFVHTFSEYLVVIKAILGLKLANCHLMGLT